MSTDIITVAMTVCLFKAAVTRRRTEVWWERDRISQSAFVLLLTDQSQLKAATTPPLDARLRFLSVCPSGPEVFDLNGDIVS